MPPETRYARSGDVSIAYQVVGDGPFDVVFVPPSSSHVELGWEVPTMRALFEGISTFARLIVFDKRGTGMSDPVTGAPSLETRMDDVRAVMDAADCERAAIMGWSEGVAMSALFAATYPQRAWALVLYGGFARELRAHDYPWGDTEARVIRLIEGEREVTDRAAATSEAARSGMPTGTDEEIAALARLMRQSISPGASEALAWMNIQIDIRHVLPAIRVPTLVLHNAGDRWVEIERGRDLANRIPGSKFVEFDIEGHITPAADMPPVLDEIERFLRASLESDATVSLIVSSPRCSSPTSSTRPRTWRSWETPAGGSCSSGTTPSFAPSSLAPAVMRSTRPATASSPRSTGPPVPFAARSRSSMECTSSALTFAPASTPESARSWTAR